jgi:hypothetical protein
MSTVRRQQDLFRVTVASHQEDAIFDAVIRRAEESPRRPDVAQAGDGRFRAVVYLRSSALEKLRAKAALDIVATENISERLRLTRKRRTLH